MSPADFRSSPNMDDILSRIQDLHFTSHLQTALSQYSSNATSMGYSDESKNNCALDAPFAMSYRRSPKEFDHDDFPIIIDTFAPKPLASDFSPASSSSRERGSVSPPHAPAAPKSPSDAFVATRSRVVRLYNLPVMAESFLSAVFLPPNAPALGSVPTPITLWTLRDSGPGVDSVWAVFKSHEEACAGLSLSGPIISVAPALESDLEPYHKLQRFELKPTSSLPSTQPMSAHTSRQPTLRVSSSYPDLQGSGRPMPDKSSAPKQDYTISSNPPNPRSNFRIGDWICSSPKCAAHNFGRNLVCIGCGCPRASNGIQSLQYPSANPPGARTLPSPRFASQQNYSPQPLAAPFSVTHSPSSSTSTTTGTPVGNLPKPSHPLLTPSGRAFAIGGRVQNISSDPLTPCIMYWPDNEPFPEQGQIRPNGLLGVPHPPILNTGNRGPISHQPGDWICKKCNYLNWRRRKVCQTCLPYAEGNGDSISAAVQAERIALLTSVLAQTQIAGSNSALKVPQPQARSHSSTPPHVRRTPIEASQGRSSVHRSQSQLDLGAQYTSQEQFAIPRPIYQTSGRRQPSPLYSTAPEVNRLQIHDSAPLLPSFLQEIVQSPAASPASSSSADLSSFEDELASFRPIASFPAQRTKDSPGSNSPSGNIWRLDGEESKSLSAFALPNQRDLVGARNASLMLPRVQLST
ncbi:hypothetical protein AMATHDRAFT_62011 [Amanita thiersii Skay4041]|uniref:RanBP2-type domain-containing protein n=1 Tax=Amanita thiersii Skay4041 TaxID=703135 RepID=A0A2A9NG67_9AGAR|nr:hypothetical protein AMATHDRAFT_62011 [Amanita thiersii Skay4041]